MVNPTQTQLEERVIAWALSRLAIRAVIVGGSTARQVNLADEWADLDFEIFATDIGEFVPDTAWLQDFGELWACLPLQEEDGPVFITLYEGAEKVDFHFYPLAELERQVEAQRLNPAFERGYRILVDKDRLAAKLPPPDSVPPAQVKPGQAEFAFQVSAFWISALYVARQIRRRNLWVGKYRDWTAKESLLKMMEWHAQACGSWHSGHYLSQWADRATLEAVQGTFGVYTARDSWRALFEIMALFERLATETAEELGYPVDAGLVEKVRTSVRALYEGDEDAKLRDGEVAA
jgi:aminoglycoside 6-adenylyltransferase